MNSDKLFLPCINQQKSPKKYTITQLNRYNKIEFNKIAIKYRK